MMKRANAAPERAAGIVDVATHAGVSISTVSNVLNGTKSVSAELRARVLAAVDALGYSANTLAKGLKSGRTNTLCVIVPSIVSVFFPKVLRGMQTAAAENGYSLTICETGENFEKEREIVRTLRLQRVDGLLLSTCCDPQDNAAYLDELTNLSIDGKRIPVVFFEEAPREGLDAVVVDNKGAERAAAEHLLAGGRRNIAYIAAPMKRFMMGKKRMEGYLAALKGAGIEPDARLQREGDYTPASGYRAMRGLLETGLAIDAVLCGNDQMAVGAVRALLEAGRRIPEDVAVMGFDDNFPATLIDPPLSTVSVPKQRMGREAVELLLWRALEENGAPARTVRLETSVVVRRSTDPKAQSEWDLNDW